MAKLKGPKVCLDITYFAENENWKHCNKIILNMWIVPWDPFLMKKLLKSGICGSMNSARMHCSRWKSQHLQLLFNEQCMNSSRITPKRVKTKKKKTKKRKEKKNETWRLNADAAKAESKQAHNIYKLERRPDGNIHLF